MKSSRDECRRKRDEFWKESSRGGSDGEVGCGEECEESSKGDGGLFDMPWRCPRLHHELGEGDCVEEAAAVKGAVGATEAREHGVIRKRKSWNGRVVVDLEVIT